MDRAHDSGYRDLENRSYFDRWSRRYDEGRISGWFQYTQELAVRELNLKPNSRILDVGCGTGHAVVRLASMCPRGKVCGIDISAGMVAKASAKVSKNTSAKVEFLQASSDDIPYPAAEFDHVLCTNSFHHYPSPSRVLEEMRRVLKPGGQLVILENAPDLSWYTLAWDRILRLVEKGHVRYYTSREIGVMLRASNFDELKLCYLGNEFLKHGKIFASIQVWSAYTPRATKE